MKKENKKFKRLVSATFVLLLGGSPVMNITAFSDTKVETVLVNSTITAASETSLVTTADHLTVNGRDYSYADSIRLVDPAADPAVVGLYQYLKAVGESDAVLYGHMEDTVLKAGSPELTCSDTADVTGSYSAIIGLDAGNLFDGFAEKYNSRNPGSGLPSTNTGNLEAAARFSNEAIEAGGIITLSVHMPNFSAVPAREGLFANSYDGFDYLVTDSYSLSGNTMNEILPGGLYQDQFHAYLDMIADYAKQVDGPVLFRPFHENTGSWFWWGKAFCSPETYQNVFRYTVEYLRDERDIHNMLYLYGPGSEADTLAEYEERYPGDAYIDLVGFDTYDNNPVPDSEGYAFQHNLEQIMTLTDSFAKKHGKLFAVTETGISTSEGGILESGNRRPEWYEEILEIVARPEYDCCYFMLWSNYSREGSYYTPFVEAVNADGTLYGHELLDPFIRFYNDKRSIFANDQLVVINAIEREELLPPEVQEWDQPSGYIISPLSGTRVLEAMTLQGRVSQDASAVSFRLSGNGNEAVIPAVTTGKKAVAELDAETLATLGQAADGRIGLYSGDVKLQEIWVLFNIEPRPEDPFLVDDFENYAGLNHLLTAAWAVNKDNGCQLDISLSDDYAYDGEWSLKFEYQETQYGWAGCVLSKETDWSSCNALQFMLVPDTNHQRTIIQINTEGNGTYEAWLQEYPEYLNAGGPLLVTLPFTEFLDRNAGTAFSSELASKVTSIGLWVNAIPESAAIDSDGMVHGILYYDTIRAIYTDEGNPVFTVLESAGKHDLAAEGKAAEPAEDKAIVTAEEVVSEAVEPKGFSPVTAVAGGVVILSLLGLGWFVCRNRKAKKGN